MEQLRRAMENIQLAMGRLGPTQKLLFASLAVIALMTLFLVSQYAAKPAMVDFMAQGSDTQLVATLRGAGINATSENGRVLVPAGSEHAAIAQLTEAGQLPNDTTILFNNLIQSQDWKATREQHRQQATIALQNELSRVISQIRGVNKATVIIDAPESSGLGRAVKEPSAAVTVFTSGGLPVPQETVDAIASLVSGAKAGLAPTRVQVIDGTTGRPRQASDDESMASGRYLEHKREIERYTQREIERLLSHIPGVVVTVNAAVDVTSVARTQQRYYKKDEGSVSIASKQSGTEDTTTQATRGAEPGLRSTSTADISGAGGAKGSESSKSNEESEFQVGLGSERTETIDPRGMPTHLTASVMIPQPYIESLVRQARPEADADKPVTIDEAQVYFGTLKETLEAWVLARLETVDDQGEPRSGKVIIGMAPISLAAMGGVSSAGMLGVAGTGGGGIGGLISASGMIETVVLGVLALIAVGMMLMVVRRAGTKVDLPTAEELVGMPPALQVVGDLIGEADEGDSPMAGIEVSEDELKIQKMREQVSELIGSNPEAAATLIGRWIGEDD